MQQIWSYDPDKPSEMALSMARDIFSMGDEPPLGEEPADKVQRLAFKGGDYPDHETDLGGMNIFSLAQRIDASLRNVTYEIVPVLQLQKEAT